MSFLQAIYGYWAPGEGLDEGRYGFGFQSVSPSVGPDERRFVEGKLTYQAPRAWVSGPKAGDRTGAESPPSFAFAKGNGGLLGMATGRYLGVGFDGREGAQVTHAVMTREPDDFGATRPAQFFGASWWRSEAAASKELEPLEAPLPWAESLSLGTVAEGLRRDPYSRDDLEWLAVAQRQALQGRAKIVVVSDDPEQVIRLLAAATSLIPMREALDMTFRVFTADMSRATEAILVVHPSSGVLRSPVSRMPGYLGIDLATRERTDLEIDPGTRDWVSMFLDAPNSVADSAEIADIIGGVAQPRARVVAAIATGAAEARDAASVESVCSSLAEMPEEIFEALGTELLDALRGASDRGVGIAGLAAGAALQASVPTVGDHLRLAAVGSLQNEGEAAAVLDVVPARRGPNWQDATSAEESVDLLITGCRDQSPRQRLEALAAAWRLGVPDSERLDPLLEGLVDHLIAAPAMAAGIGEWLGMSQLRQQLLLGLESQFVDGARSIQAAVSAGAYDFLAPLAIAGAYRFPRLATAIAPRLLPTLVGSERQDAMYELASAWPNVTWDALWLSSQPTAGDLLIWLRVNPSEREDRSLVESLRVELAAAFRSGDLDQHQTDLLVAARNARMPLPAQMSGLAKRISSVLAVAEAMESDVSKLKGTDLQLAANAIQAGVTAPVRDRAARALIESRLEHVHVASFALAAGPGFTLAMVTALRENFGADPGRALTILGVIVYVGADKGANTPQSREVYLRLAKELSAQWDTVQADAYEEALASRDDSLAIEALQRLRKDFGPRSSRWRLGKDR